MTYKSMSLKFTLSGATGQYVTAKPICGLLRAIGVYMSAATNVSLNTVGVGGLGILSVGASAPTMNAVKITDITPVGGNPSTYDFAVLDSATLIFNYSAGALNDVVEIVLLVLCNDNEVLESVEVTV
jgi:hypothetical protein